MPPVPSAITDLSTTAASNSPAGSDNVFPDLDNYLRAHASFIAQNYANKLSSTGGTLTGVLLSTAGSASAPGIAFTGDANTGIWSPAADTFAVSTGGTERLRVISTGEVGVGVTPTAGRELEVYRASAGVNVVARADSGQLASVQLAGNATTVGTTSFDIVQSASSVAQFVQRANADMEFYTNGTIRMTLDTSNRLLFSGVASRQIGNFSATGICVDAAQNAGAGFVRNTNDNSGPFLVLGKSRGTVGGSATIVQSGDQLGSLEFAGADGTDIVTVGASISAFVDGTPGSNDLPTRLVLSTTPDGASAPVERARIDNLGYGQMTVNSLGAGRIPAKQYFRLNADLAGSNVNTVQSMFGVGVTLVGSTVYEFEWVFVLAKSAGTTSHQLTAVFGGTATLNNGLIVGLSDGAAGSLPAFDDNSTASFASDTLGTEFVISQSSSTAAITRTVKAKGTISINAGGTLIPQYRCSSAPGGAYSTIGGSYFSIWPLGASGSNTSIGTWA